MEGKIRGITIMSVFEEINRIAAKARDDKEEKVREVARKRAEELATMMVDIDIKIRKHRRKKGEIE